MKKKMARRKVKLAAPAPADAAPAGSTAADGAHAAPPQGEWYAPQGDDNSPAVDYFADNRGLVSRILSLGVISVLIVAMVTMAAMWFAAPMLETRIQIPPGRPRVARQHSTTAPATAPAELDSPAPTTAPVTSLPTD